MFIPRRLVRVRKGLIVSLVVGLVPLWGACTGLRPRPTPVAAQPAAGKKPITMACVWGPQAVHFDGSYASGMQWLPDGQHFLQRRDDILQQVDALTDAAEPAYDSAAFEDVLKKQGDFDEGAARHLARHPSHFNDDRSVALLEHQDKLYFYRLADQTVKRVTEEGEPRPHLTLSPDATHVAFVKDNNIYALAITTGQRNQLTKDGSDLVLNGVLDWVYQEEIYGRGHWRSYWWSKDGGYIAYLQLDEHDVPLHQLVDFLPIHPAINKFQYPKAGDPNPKPRLGVVRADGGDTVWADLSPYSQTDILIVGVSWSPDGKVIYAVQDRESRWLDLNEAEPDTGHSRTLLHETSPAWVDYEGAPHWLDDQTFLWFSARDGWKHLYHYARDGTLIRRVTEGPWEARELHGVDPKTGWVYFSGTRESHVESNAYRVQLTGGPIERLTQSGSSHRCNFDPQFRYFFDTFSNVNTPTKVYLRSSDGMLVKVVSPNEVASLNEYNISPPEVLRIPTPLGHDLNGVIVRTPVRDPQRKYPVYTFVYGGPHMPSVHNSWGGHDFVYKQWLAQEGYLVWTCDPYSASGEGAISAWHAYQKLGVTELEDLEASLRWLAEHEQADLDRVAITGHSYGGFMTTFALTHSKMFKVGLAGSALTDWRNYDTVYAEKLLRTPQNDPEGYKLSSVVEAAKDLHGHLLIGHGAVDDNVHLQNIMQFIDGLEKANKDFKLNIYPSDDHGLWHYWTHWRDQQIEFLKKNL